VFSSHELSNNQHIAFLDFDEFLYIFKLYDIFGHSKSDILNNLTSRYPNMILCSVAIFSMN